MVRHLGQRRSNGGLGDGEIRGLEISGVFIKHVSQECIAGGSIVKSWWEIIKKWEHRLNFPVPFPNAITVQDLLMTYPTEKLLRESFAVIQRAFVSVLGALRWLLLIDNQWEESLKRMVKMQVHGNVHKLFVGWGLLKHHEEEEKYVFVPGGRGLLFDPVQDWRHISLHLYIKNDILVSYPWTPDLQSRPRFRALSPFHTGVLPIEFGTLLPSWYRELKDSDHFMVFFTNKYLQAKFDSTTPPVEVRKGRQQSGLTMTQLAVHFEHWKPRPKLDRTDQQRLFNSCFYKEIALSTNSKPTFKRFLFGYRSRTSLSYDSDSDSPMEGYQGKIEPLEKCVMREVYKFSYAPPPGQKYLCSQLHLQGPQNEDHPEEAEDLPPPYGSTCLLR